MAVLSEAEQLDAQIKEVLKEGVTLMSIQRDAVAFLVKNPRSLYSDDLGFGKTLVALVVIGVLALRSETGTFRMLIGVYNSGIIKNWLGEINKFIKPGFFHTQKLAHNNEALVKAPRLIVFTTYTRMRNIFRDSLGCLPEGTIPEPQKRNQKKKKVVNTTVYGTIIDEGNGSGGDDADDFVCDGPSLVDAMLAPHGLHQVAPGRSKRPAAAGGPVGEDEEEEVDEATIKNTNVEYFRGHSMADISKRRAIFETSRYWDHRVDKNSWLPNAPMLNRGSNHPPMFSITWNGVLFDEAHELKDVKTAQAKAALFLYYSHLVLWQTGTVIQNNLSEARSALLMVRDSRVCCELGEMRSGDGTLLKGEAAQQARMLKSLTAVTFRRSQEELIKSCPDVLAQDSRTAYMLNTKLRRGIRAKYFASQAERELHDRYVRKLRNVAERLLLNNRAKKAGLLPTPVGVKRKEPSSSAISDSVVLEDDDSLLKAYTRALQVCAAAEIIDEEGEHIPNIEEFGIGSTKMKMLMELIRDCIPAGEKIIIFDHRVKVLRVVARLLCANGINSVLIAGDKSETKRDLGLESWKRTDSGVNVLLAQTKICGTGYTWTEAHYVVHLTAPLNPAVEDQANWRPRRPGQTSDVIVYILIIAGSVEELALESQTRKRRDNAAYMSGAEIASKSKKDRIDLTPDEFIRYANSVLDGATSGEDTQPSGGNAPAVHGTGLRGNAVYRERDTLRDDERVEELRTQFHGPSWVKESMMIEGKIYFLDPAQSYSNAGFLPRGSLLFTVSSAGHAYALAQAYMIERNRQRYAAMNPGSSTLGKTKKAKVVNIGQPAAPQDLKPLSIALCPVSLYVLFKREFFDELARQGKMYIDRVMNQTRMAARQPSSSATYQRPLAAAHGDFLFPSSAPPTVSQQQFLDPDRIGEAYTNVVKLIGNRTTKPGGGTALSSTSGGPTVNLDLLTTPAEVASVLKTFSAPQLAIIRPLDTQLQRGKHIEDAYHAKTQPNGHIELKGTVAAHLTNPALPSFQCFTLDVDVLLSFSPCWLQPRLELNDRLTHPGAPRRDAIDLYAPGNEVLRKKLHWISTDTLGTEVITKDSMLMDRCDFTPQAMRTTLLPLLIEASTIGCSAYVRAMATAVISAYAISGCDLTRIYMFGCGDRAKTGAGQVQGVFVAVRSNRNTLVGAGIYLRSPHDHTTREILQSAIGILLRNAEIRYLVNAQESLAPMTYDRSWCRTPRPSGQPVCFPNTKVINWGAYAVGYCSYHREETAQVSKKE